MSNLPAAPGADELGNRPGREEPPDDPWVVGETVPWSVAWSGEMAFDLALSTDFPGSTELVQKHDPGVGRPLFAVNHVTRNRAGLARHLCHVCGGATRRGDRWLFPLQTGGPVTLLDGEVRYGGNVPPVHGACAERARRLCPHLSHALASAVPFPDDDEGRLIARTDVVPGMEAVAERLPPGLPVILSCYRLHGPRFSALVAKLREAAAAGG